MPEQPSGNFDRYWDDVAAGRPADQADVDPFQADTVRRFHDVPDVSGPDPAFLARLETDLGLASERSGAIDSGIDPRAAMNGWLAGTERRQQPRLARIPQEHRWRYVAAAAVLFLLIAAAGYFVY